MAERQVKIALIAYSTEGPDDKPLSAYAQRGETVQVHESDVERFDSLNDEFSGPPVGEVFVPQPDPLDHGAGGPVGDFERPERDSEVDADVNEGSEGRLEEPNRRDPLADWQAYAEQEGVATEDENGSAKTKKELIAELTED